MPVKTLLITAVLWICLAGCGWEQKATFRSPSSTKTVVLDQPFPMNMSGLRILLTTKEHTKTLYSARGDTFVEFADVAWSDHETITVVFTCGSPAVRLAYRSKDETFIEFAQMLPLLMRHIRDHYHLDPSITDDHTSAWACSSEGKAAFLRLYPSARAR